MIKLDLDNPIHADAFLTTAGNFLVEWPDTWSAQKLSDELASESRNDADEDDDVVIWEPFEHDEWKQVLEWIEDATVSTLKLLKRHEVEGVE
jgi:hypothetical protein